MLRIIEPTLTPLGISFDDTKLDPRDRQALTPGIKTALRRLRVNLAHPTNDDLMRCLAGGGRVAQRAVKRMGCSTRERMSHRPSRIPTDGELFDERPFVDMCDVRETDTGSSWQLISTPTILLLRHVPATRAKPLPNTCSNTGLGGQDPLTYWGATESGACEPRRFSQKKLSVSGTRVQTTAAQSPWQKGRVEQRIATIKEVAGKTILQHQVASRSAMSVVSCEVAHALKKGEGGWAFLQRPEFPASE